jgi:hypothetical protein
MRKAEGSSILLVVVLLAVAVIAEAQRAKVYRVGRLVRREAKREVPI